MKKKKLKTIPQKRVSAQKSKRSLKKGTLEKKGRAKKLTPKKPTKKTAKTLPLKEQKEDKIFLKKMLESVLPQMAEQILARALLISKQLRRKGPTS